MRARILGWAALAGAAFVMAAGGVSAQTLEKIKQRGTLIVGVKADYKPFGYRDPSGKIVGFEPDLAQDVADTLGVKLELEPVISSNRMQFLQQGKIDLMIATMNDKADRREVVGIIEPSYYASGVDVMAAKKLGFKQWEQLKGKPVCAIQGAWYNKPLAEKYGMEIVAFKGTAEAQTALVQGNCVAWAYDDTAFPGLLEDKAKWGDYEMPLPSIMPDPWGVAVPLPERNKTYGRFVSGVVYEWHRSGKLIELEKKWGLPASPFLVEMHQKCASLPLH